jgi:hypothetical protein
VLLSTTLFGLSPSGILYFFARTRPSTQRLTSAHFFSDISRLRLARDLGGDDSYDAIKVYFGIFFFFVLSYSHEAYLDYGGAHF